VNVTRFNKTATPITAEWHFSNLSPCATDFWQTVINLYIDANNIQNAPDPTPLSNSAVLVLTPFDGTLVFNVLRISDMDAE
jgi:hypothetical protein